MFFELKPIDGRKSFYGKCRVESVELAEHPGYNVFSLWSYDTLVCQFDSYTCRFIRLWDDYSATTMRHVNSFMRFVGSDRGGKSWLDSVPAGVWVEV